MQSDTLIRDLLRDLKRTMEAEGSLKVPHVSVALDTVEEFLDISSATTSFTDGVKLVVLFNQASPTGLESEDRLSYVLFIHELFCEGTCYGMVEEDPVNGLVLLGSAFQLVKELSSGDQTDFHLVGVGLDLLLHEALALRRMGEVSLAKTKLVTILEVAQDLDNIQVLYNVQDPNAVINGVARRAAPAAWLLSRMLYVEEEVEAAAEYLSIAEQLYEQLSVKQSVSRQYVLALIGLSEVLAVQEKLVSCTRKLDKAIRVSKKLLSKKRTAMNAFMASAAYHRRGELYALAAEWDRALSNFTNSLHWIDVAKELAPNNTYYDEKHVQYLNELGVFYGVQGDVVKAQQTFIKAIQYNKPLVSQSEKYKGVLATTLNNMSILMNRFGNYPVAISYLKESIEVIDGMGEAFTNLNRKELKDALTESLEAMEQLVRDSKNKPWRPIWNPSQSTPSSSRPN